MDGIVKCFIRGISVFKSIWPRVFGSRGSKTIMTYFIVLPLCMIMRCRRKLFYITFYKYKNDIENSVFKIRSEVSSTDWTVEDQ